MAVGPTGTVPQSSFTISVVERDAAHAVEIDGTQATVPNGTEFWEITVNGSLRARVSARPVTLFGARLTDDEARNGIRVSVQATTTGGDVLATTG